MIAYRVHTRCNNSRHIIIKIKQLFINKKWLSAEKAKKLKQSPLFAHYVVTKESCFMGMVQKFVETVL